MRGRGSPSQRRVAVGARVTGRNGSTAYGVLPQGPWHHLILNAAPRGIGMNNLWEALADGSHIKRVRDRPLSAHDAAGLARRRGGGDGRLRMLRPPTAPLPRFPDGGRPGPGAGVPGTPAI